MNTIPPMTHELGRYWDQPNPARILIDDTHAVMDEATLKALHEYSTTMPTGVYEGKMWKANRWERAPGGAIRMTDRWLLRWYGFSDKPDCCSNNQREILIA